MNQLSDQLPIGFLAHWYRRGQGFESRPAKPEFFQAFFSQLQKLRLQRRWSFLHLRFNLTSIENNKGFI